MSERFACRAGWLKRDGGRLRWRHLQRRESTVASRRGCLLLLHGAGVGGEPTWLPMVPYLEAWDSLLIPDLRGTGETVIGADEGFTLEHVVADVEALLALFGTVRCDVAGYSFGGLVAMALKQQLPATIERTFLLEPAMLERAEAGAMQEIAQAYRDAAADMGRPETRDLGLDRFLDLVAPRRLRHPVAERVTRERLLARPLGLAGALACIAETIVAGDREVLMASQHDVITLVGGRSDTALQECHRWLAETRPAWTCRVIPGADHALPYQKPRRVGRLLSSEATSIDA
ncbi:alpha/beta fold hydrolase [Salinicola avicenniae]|uniref:alpha/beta fold hydrolase n=1 Tax=Salinicola avicenniae TaxID=2916836 RepID=UPI0020731E12|nr:MULTISPECIES: alpha/beta hydrolase [unclassified Salinicola]